jgi:hypothetical protein
MRRFPGGTGTMSPLDTGSLIFTRRIGQGLNCTCRVPCEAEEHVRAASCSDWECTSVRHGMGINRVSLAILNITFGDKQVMVWVWSRKADRREVGPASKPARRPPRSSSHLLRRLLLLAIIRSLTPLHKVIHLVPACNWKPAAVYISPCTSENYCKGWMILMSTTS